MEFNTFDAGRLQQPPVGLTEAVDLALNHAANRRRYINANLLNRLRKDPPPLVLSSDFPVSQVPHQVHHEQRIPFRAFPQQFCKGRRETVLWELQCQVALDISLGETIQVKFAGESTRFQLPPDLMQW